MYGPHRSAIQHFARLETRTGTLRSPREIDDLLHARSSGPLGDQDTI